MNTHTSHETLWSEELAQLAENLGVKTPRFTVISTAPPLLSRIWDMSHGAWGSWNRVIITADLLQVDPTVRKYVLAHELGHISKRHSLPLSASFVFFLCAVVITAAHHKWPLLLSLLILFGSLAFLLIVSLRLEYQADEVAVRLLGKGEAIRGCIAMARLTGTENNYERRKRLRRMSRA